MSFVQSEPRLIRLGVPTAANVCTVYCSGYLSCATVSPGFRPQHRHLDSAHALTWIVGMAWTATMTREYRLEVDVDGDRHLRSVGIGAT